MTVREWCSRTSNVFYGATALTIYQMNEPPLRVLVGMIPEEISRLEIQTVKVLKVNLDRGAPIFVEIEVMCE